MAFVRRYRVSLVLLVLLAIVVALVIGRLRDQQARAVPRANREIQVGVVKPTRRPLDVTLSFTGDVLPNRQTPIFAKTSGYIRAIHVERGQFVKAGTLLVEIEPTEMENALDQTRAALASAEASLQVSRSNLDAAKANLLNQQALLVVPAVALGLVVIAALLDGRVAKLPPGLIVYRVIGDNPAAVQLHEQLAVNSLSQVRPSFEVLL